MANYKLLNSINILLASIDEEKINTLDDLENIKEAEIANDVLEETKLEVLSYGWHVNMDNDWEFIPDTDGFISVPKNVLNIGSSIHDYVMRDNRIYDKEKRTYKFDKAIECDVVWDSIFDALPQALAYYITVKASRTYAYRMIGDVKQYQFSQEDVLDAKMTAQESDDFSSRRNLKKGDYGYNFMRGYNVSGIR